MKSIIYLLMIVVSNYLLSCGNASKEKKENKDDVEVISGKSTIKSSKHIDDSIAKQMMDMFGMENETFHDMMKTDSLEVEIYKMFNTQGLQKLLDASNLTEEEKQKLMSEMQKVTANVKTNGNKSIQGNTKAAMDTYFMELEKVLTNSGSKQQLKELQAMMEKQNIKDQLDRLETSKPDSKVENLRNILETDEKSYIENDLTSYSLYGNKEKNEALKKLSSASKQEGETVLMDYYQISKKELDLLKTMPAKQDILSENVAKPLFEEQVPKSIASHNSSGKASPKFKSLTQYFYQEQKGRANNFIQKSKDARKKFYAENPGWYGEKSASGNTYVDSRHQYIFLPLGSLSFADKVVSHDIGKLGSNTKGSIGEPDFALELFNKPDPRICNLGTKGVLTLEFTDNAIADVNGPDIYIFEMGRVEPTNLKISKDGKTWIDVGKIEGGTAKVDIAPFVKKGETFNYVRLTDLETFSELPGADVDAVAAIGGALRLNLDSAVLFDTGKFQLKESASGELKKLVDAIKAIPKAKIVVEGHTDNDGNPSNNKTLSENRAKEVSNYIKTKLSSTYTFEIKGYGDSQPIAPNDTDENKQKNRRVEILVIPN